MVTTGSVWVVSRLVAMQPPWSIATSTITDPGFMRRTSSSSTRVGARPPGNSTAPISRSAPGTSRSIRALLLTRVTMRPRRSDSSTRSFWGERSSRNTSASMAAAIRAAFQPTVPAPSTTTRAGRTPVQPPIRMPRPPWGFSNRCAPTWAASRPATSLIGASSGRLPSSSCTVS